MSPLADWLMALGPLKPILTSLLLPPGGPLLLVFAGLGLGRVRHLRTAGRAMVALGLMALWVLSTQSAAVWLSRHALPQVSAASVEQLRQQQVQAVVVLGGGIRGQAEEYGAPQLNPASMERLRYGALLAHELQVPLAYAGGVGWSQTGNTSSEADIAQRVAGQAFGVSIAFSDALSRDTRENGQQMLALLQQRQIGRVALVTHAWHMPRSLRAFSAPDMEVVPAPMGFIGPYERPLLDALPSGHGLATSRLVLREWLGLLLS